MRWLLVLALLLACKSKSEQDKPQIVGTRSVITYVGRECEAALSKAASAPLDARPGMLLESCRGLCNDTDWMPLLQWNLEPEHGGPRREQIEKIMVECDAFCTGDSKLKFMSAVDKTRGQNVDTPWRQLAKTCKEKVNAAADERFMSAPFFMLDRIARAAANGPRGTELAAKLAGIEMPLPAVTISGAGVALPEADGVLPSVGPVHITVLGDAIYVGRMPRGKLTAGGVTVDLGASGYPGEQVKVEELGEKLTALVGERDKTQPITLLAPNAMPAQKLVPIIVAASAVAPVHLGANAPESPEGWQLPGAVPIALAPGKDIAVTAEMTVQNLAKELAARAASKQARVGVTTK